MSILDFVPTRDPLSYWNVDEKDDLGDVIKNTHKQMKLKRFRKVYGDLEEKGQLDQLKDGSFRRKTIKGRVVCYKCKKYTSKKKVIKRGSFFYCPTCNEKTPRRVKRKKENN